MSGTKRGGLAASLKNKQRYGSDFYKKIGAKGGKISKTGGFYANRKAASYWGAIGGAKSRRGSARV